MRRLLFITSLLLAVYFTSQAQTNFGLWTNIAIEKELSEKFELQLEEEARFENNPFKLDRLITEISANYKVNKYYKLSLSYRFSYYLDGNIGNRITLSNNVKYKIEDFTLHYRFNLQTDFNTSKAIAYKVRNRIGLDYKINKKWETGIKTELFYSIYYYENMFDRYRISYGVDYKINKHHKISPGIMFQSDFNIVAPEKDVVLSIQYKYSF